LQPEDLQTAGRINPETKKPEFNTDTDGYQLIGDTAPLGSLAQKGLPDTVEASQLSRALTLAEMVVKEAPVPNDECVCLLGRSDLAFINIGYQVKTLFGSTSSKDDSGLPTGGNSGSATEFGTLSTDLVNKRKTVRESFGELLDAKTDEEITRVILKTEEAFAVLEADPLTQIDYRRSRQVAHKRDVWRRIRANLDQTLGGQKGELTAAQQKVVAEIRAQAIAKAFDEASQALADEEGFDLSGALENDPLQEQAKVSHQEEEIAAALAEGRPVVGSAVPSGEDLQLRVETYLVNLYSALDTDHQQFEKALRGELLPQGNLNPDDVRFPQNAPPTTPAPFAPPFNAPNRALGGDPEALALSAKSNLGDIQKTWSNFGSKLSANTQRTKLEAEIRKDQSKLSRLEAQKEQVENFLSNSGNVRPKFEGDPTQQLADLNKEIARLEQDVQRKQNEAAQLPT
jgi:hypothetical protein